MYRKFYLLIFIFSFIFSQVLLSNENNGSDKDNDKDEGKPLDETEIKDNNFDINEPSTSTGITANSGQKLSSDINPKCNPYLKKRPQPHANLPSMKIVFDGIEYQATRHHIIEYNILRDFLMAIEEEDRTTEYGKLIENWLIEIVYNFMCDRQLGELLQERIRRQSRPSININQLEETKVVNTISNANRRFVRLFCWPTGLMFIAMSPELRGDDPGDGMEKGARYIIGDEQYENACLLRETLLNYIGNSMYRNPITLTLIRQLLTPFLRRNIPWMFDESQWVYRPLIKNGKPVYKDGKPVYKFFIRTTDESVEGPTDNNKRKKDDDNNGGDAKKRKQDPSNKSKRSVNTISNEFNPIDFYYNTECDCKECRTLDEMIDQYYIDCQFDYY